MNFLSTIGKYCLHPSLLQHGRHLTLLHLSENSRFFCKLSSTLGSNKHSKKRAIKVANIVYQDLPPAVEEELKPLRDLVTKQGTKVKELNASSAPETIIKKEIQELKKRKKELEENILKLILSDTFDKAKFDYTVKKKFFFDRSFHLYKKAAGRYDYGPNGCSILDNIIYEWEKFFVICDQMMKVKCSTLTPAYVLEASGHVDKFADYMVKDEITGERFRLDHLLKQILEERLKTNAQDAKDLQQRFTNIDGMSLEEMTKTLYDFDIKSPSGNTLSSPIEMNLMFPVLLDPTGKDKGYLRPETSQGILLNFKRLFEINQRKLPFACAQIGNAFRNEINLYRGLLRVQEFTMGEIMYFSYPDDKSHPKFKQISHLSSWLYSSHDQMGGLPYKRITFQEAVEQKIISSEALAYFMARIQLFLLKIGIDGNKLRFRQHLSQEMAHYACECWDAECLTSYGWTECVGCADRGTYDLDRHSKKSGMNLAAQRELSQPRMIDTLVIDANKSLMKMHFKEEFQSVIGFLHELSHEGILAMENSLRESGEFVLQAGYVITKDMIRGIRRERKETHLEYIVPNIIEPSFGFGRIFYTLLEHSFKSREDDARVLFSFPTCVAPFKTCILPVIQREEFDPFIQQIAEELAGLDLVYKVETKGSIGRRYTRADMIGVPFCITVDSDTCSVSPPTVTLRERDSTDQVRIPVNEVCQIILDISRAKLTWESVKSSWPCIKSQELNKED